MLNIYLPGTGGMKPLPERFLTGLWIEKDGKALLVDCGECMQVALAKQNTATKESAETAPCLKGRR